MVINKCPRTFLSSVVPCESIPLIEVIPISVNLRRLKRGDGGRGKMFGSHWVDRLIRTGLPRKLALH